MTFERVTDSPVSRYMFGFRSDNSIWKRYYLGVISMEMGKMRTHTEEGLTEPQGMAKLKGVG